MFAMDASTGQYYLVIYLINVVGSLFAGILLLYHVKNLLRGRTTHEKTKQYDFGRNENIRIALGERWHLTWLSPFIESPLSHDGIEWHSADEEDRVKHS